MRGLLALLCCLMLTGCGYRPLYSNVDGTGGVAAALERIEVAEQRNRPGQLVRNELLKSMAGRNSDRYRLTLSVAEADVYVSRLPGQPVDRKRYRLVASYELLDSATRKAVLRSSSQSLVGYDTVREPIADLQARDTAMKRAAIEVGQDIRLRISAFLAR